LGRCTPYMTKHPIEYGRGRSQNDCENQGVYLLRKVTADRAEFSLISLWEDRSPSDEDSRTSGQGGKERLRIQYLARSPDSRGIRG